MLIRKKVIIRPSVIWRERKRILIISQIIKLIPKPQIGCAFRCLNLAIPGDKRLIDT